MSGSANYHAREGASKADQWVSCTKSNDYIEYLIRNGDIPVKQVSKGYTTDGTDAHDYAEKALLFQTGKIKKEPSYPKKIVAEDETHLIDSYVNEVLDTKGEHLLMVEVVVPLFYDNDETGTSDAVIITDEAVHIRDLKWGHMHVSSRFNKQGMIYARSTIENIINDQEIEGGKYDTNIKITDDTVVTIGIIQPRTAGDNDLHETTWGELKLDTMEIEVAYRKIKLKRDLEFKPTKKGCQWCRAKEMCVVRTLPVNTLPQDLNYEDNKLTLARRLVIEDNKNEITAFINKNSEELLEIAQTRELPNYKVGTTRGRRFYRDESSVIKWAKTKKPLDEIAPRKLISLTALEKLVGAKGKRELADSDLLGKSQGNPKLVRDGSPSRPFSDSLAGLFDEVGESEESSHLFSDT